jgi:putative nucleotidyltransferase with HDIG domain
MSAMPRILFVLDNPVRTQELLALFHEVAPERPVEVTANEKDALAAIEKADFEMIFVELSGGALAGTRFLNEVWKARPKIVRFLLGSDVDADLLVTCVLGAHHLVRAPFDANAVRGALERADSINQLIRNERIQSLVSRMRTLPSRPSLYMEVMRELRSTNASANMVGDLVSKDLAISSKLIQVVNSAFYGLQQHVSDPAAAVLLLGLETTSSLVLSIEAFARFDKVKPLYFSMDKVWRHCQTVANSAKQIAELLNNDPEVARHAYTAGLLHDIGKLALALNFEDQYHGALKLAEKQKISPCEVESQVFGATHAEAGAYLLCLWGLPLQVVEAVLGHHYPAGSVGKKFTAATALHLAESLEHWAELERNGVRDAKLDFAYPPELGIAARMDELKRIVQPENAPEKSKKTELTEDTFIFTRQELKAEPSQAPPEPAPEAVPAQSIEIPEVPAAFSNAAVSRKRSLAVFASIAVGGLVLAAVAVRANRQRTLQQAASAQASREQKDERPKDLSDHLLSPSHSQPKPANGAEGPGIAHGNAGIDSLNLKLQAILFNGSKSSLVINGQSLHLGDEVEGAKIVSVGKDAVTLEKDGAQRKLTLK